MSPPPSDAAASSSKALPPPPSKASPVASLEASKALLPPPPKVLPTASKFGSSKRSASADPAVARVEPTKAKAVSAVGITRYRNSSLAHDLFFLEAHEVQFGDDTARDWTGTDFVAEELRLREERNQQIKAQLLEGMTVAHRPSGWSLYPRVFRDDLCYYKPVSFDEQVEVDDIVFCQVQPSGDFYAALLKDKEWHDADRRWKYWISNLKGVIDGYCYIQHIYGRLWKNMSAISMDA